MFLEPSSAWTGPLPFFLTGKSFAFPALTSFLSAFGRQKWTLRSTEDNLISLEFFVKIIFFFQGVKHPFQKE